MREDETEKIAQARVGTVINGKWTVERLIGVGGMASVYAATHRNSKRAALKIMHPELSAQPNVRERFLREGYLANMVDHPGVVTIDDDDMTEDGCAFLVMELVEGETLEARLRRKGPLPAEEVLHFMDQVLHALATAHTRGVVHRDLKPENMLLSQNGEVKLLDFGIARARALSTDPTKTLTEGLMGTPAFMPPEQARGRWEEVDAQSDVWALGATMFTLLTGRNVHQAATTNEALAVAMMHRAPLLQEYRPELPSSLLELVNKALSYEKKDRWPNATVMLLAIRKASARLEEDTLEAEAVAAALELNADSQTEVYFSESEAGSEEVGNYASMSDADALDDADQAGYTEQATSAFVHADDPPTNPVSSLTPFLSANQEAELAGEAEAAVSSAEQAPWSESSAPGTQATAPTSAADASSSDAGFQAAGTQREAASQPASSFLQTADERKSAPTAASAEAPERAIEKAAAGLPARRVVPFSDVPSTGSNTARPTETTTARSALIANARPAKRSNWSAIGAAIGAVALLLFVGVLIAGGREQSAPVAPAAGERAPGDNALVDEAAPIAEPGQAALAHEPAGPAADAAEEDSEVADAADGEAVQLDALPMLSASADAAPLTPTRRWWPKPKPQAKDSEPNVFNQARNLAVKRATVRSDKVKSGRVE